MTTMESFMELNPKGGGIDDAINNYINSGENGTK